MNNSRLAGWAASSNPLTPDEVSGRIRGAILASSALLIFLAAKFLGITLTPQDIIEFATQASFMGGLVWSLYSAGLAFVRWAATKRPA